MKDPIKFTDIESQSLTILSGIILIVMTIFLNNIAGPLWASIFAMIGIVGIILRAWRRSVKASIGNSGEELLEIDRILKKLQDFWQEYQKNSGSSWKHGGVVIKTNPFTTALVQFKCVFPKLHQEILKDSEPIKVRELYYKIEDIELIYEELRSNRAKDFKIVKQWEALVSDVLKEGNPLKTHNQSLELTGKGRGVS